MLRGGSPAGHIQVDFATVEDYNVYATHPAHVEVITKLIKPILRPGSRTAVQFWMGPAAESTNQSSVLGVQADR